MGKKFISTIILSIALINLPVLVRCQSNGKFEHYLERLPKQLKLDEKTPQKYIMTAEYFNRDIFGELGSRIKVSGEYTRGLENGYVSWNNVFIAQSKSSAEPYADVVKQTYMENIKYIPSPKMLEESFFENFPKQLDNVFSRNLIWDMMAIETFAWSYYDSLELNKTYITNINGEFDLANIGTYSHSKIELNWVGISKMNNNLCAIIEYRAFDNKLKINTNEMKSKGSELYWGKTWVSLKNKHIEYAEMYSNTIQEMEIQGLPNKILANTLRVLRLEKVQ